jgi:hypothetical protein
LTWDKNGSHYKFLSSSLDEILSSHFFGELAQAFGLKEHRKEASCIFTPQGKLVLMFLKNYAGCSDERFIEQFNSNIYC